MMNRLITKPRGRASLVRRIYHIYMLSFLACMLMTVQVRAEITPQLLYNWSYQPSNVQNNLVRKNTNIQVVDKLAWESKDLYETYAYTTMHTIPNTNYVYSIDMYIKKGEETSLTHEVGHCLSNYENNLYWWCNYRKNFC